MITTIAITVAVLLLLYSIGSSMLLWCIINYHYRLEKRLALSQDNNIKLRKVLENITKTSTEGDRWPCSLN